MPSDALPDDPMMLIAMLLAERVQNERLRQIIKDLQRHQFGRRAETLPEDWMLLGLEDVEQTAASDAAGAEQTTPAARQAGAAKRRANRGALPAHLPRIEPTIDLDDKTCLCCQGALHRIGEDRSERLDIVRRSSGCWSRSGRNTLAAPVRMASCKPGAGAADRGRATDRSYYRAGAGLQIC